MAGKYVGFDRLKGELARQPGVKDPKALAASIGRKKGKKLGPPQRPKNVPRPGQEGGGYHYG
jgi:hypothetical protein